MARGNSVSFSVRFKKTTQADQSLHSDPDRMFVAVGLQPYDSAGFASTSSLRSLRKLFMDHRGPRK